MRWYVWMSYVLAFDVSDRHLSPLHDEVRRAVVSLGRLVDGLDVIAESFEESS